jgi:GDP-mannose transporter
MSDEKKRHDDYTVDIGDRSKEGFEPLPRRQTPPAPSLPAVANQPLIAVLSYCVSSIMMTVTNKYVLSGLDYNLNFFLLCVQVCEAHAMRRCEPTLTSNSLWSAWWRFRLANL